MADKRIADVIAPVYYEQAVKAPAAIRAQAQAGSVVATAAASALIAAGAFADASAEQWWIQVSGAIAVALWGMTALLYVRAVSGAVTSATGGYADGPTSFVEAVLERSRVERAALEARAGHAFFAACLAVATTLVVIGGSLLAAPPVTGAYGDLVLSDEGREAFAGLCVAGSRIAGVVETSTLEGPTVAFKAKDCPSAPGELRLSTRLVAGFVERSKP